MEQLREELNWSLLKEAQKARRLERELYIKLEMASFSHFFRVLAAKKKQEPIQSFYDLQGSLINNPNAMAITMVNFLGSIIGQE